jgi:thymidylate kinase
MNNVLIVKDTPNVELINVLINHTGGIIIEGVDLSGKSTLIDKLSNRKVIHHSQSLTYDEWLHDLIINKNNIVDRSILSTCIYEKNNIIDTVEVLNLFNIAKILNIIIVILVPPIKTIANRYDKRGDLKYNKNEILYLYSQYYLFISSSFNVDPYGYIKKKWKAEKLIISYNDDYNEPVLLGSVGNNKKEIKGDLKQK